MIELMLNDAVIHTALPVEGDHLLATSSAKRRVAPERREEVKGLNITNVLD